MVLSSLRRRFVLPEEEGGGGLEGEDICVSSYKMSGGAALFVEEGVWRAEGGGGNKDCFVCRATMYSCSAEKACCMCAQLGGFSNSGGFLCRAVVQS